MRKIQDEIDKEEMEQMYLPKQFKNDSKLNKLSDDLQEMQMILVSVQQLINIPRSPPGPSYIARDIKSTLPE